MNFKRTLYYLVFFIIISCDEGAILINGILCADAEKSCPESIQLGEILLSDEVNTLFIYTRGDTLIFKNEEDKTLNFKVSSDYKNILKQRDINVLCYSCINESQVEFYNVESSSVSFIAIEEFSLFSLRMSVEIKRFDDSNDDLLFFYEQLIVRSNLNTLKEEELTIIPAVHEIVETSPEIFFEENEFYNFHETITLLNQNFQNIYSSLDNGQSIIYFSFSKGIIGFNIEGELWLFDSIK